ncbi:MAG: hypothetical protein Q4A16_07220 [Lautropia sp.]|nr:hypothetical protein [Lautropia sp.]
MTLVGCGQSSDDTDVSPVGQADPFTLQSETTQTSSAFSSTDGQVTDGFGTATAIPTTDANGESDILAAWIGNEPLTTPPITKTIVDVCASILTRNNQMVGGTAVHTLPLTSRPALGVAIQEPTYGSCITRITNKSETGERFHRNDYSRRQAFNADNSMMILYAEDGYWHLYDALTTKWIQRLNGLAGDAEPQWHPNNPHVIYYLPTNGIGMKMYKLDVVKNEITLVSDMSRQIRAHWPDAHTAWTRSEGSPSVDARYWCFMVENVTNGQWRPRGVFTWDLKEKRIVGTMNLSVRPDHVSMSPSGQYCVVSGDDSTGTRAYRRDFKAPYSATNAKAYLQLHHKSEHSDLAYNRRKEDVYVSIDYQANRGDVFMVNLKTEAKTSLFPTYLGRTATAIHVSGKAFRKPGWVLISTYGESHADSPWQNLRDSVARQWLHRKIFAVSLDTTPQIRSVAYAHSDSLSYWTEPHASVNRDFTRILFNSSWNSTSAKDMEAYMVALPDRALDRSAR